MARLRKCTRATVLSILFAYAHAASIPSVFGRQDSCAVDGFSACGNGLPNNFCCGTGTKCITLAGNTTVLCCPEGSSCDRISPITCNVNLQDPAAHPDAQIKTTALKAKLGTCGENKCCPFGYTCNSFQQCVMESDQTKEPEVVVTSTPGPTSTGTAPTVIPTTIAASAAPSGDNKNDNSFPTAIVIGVLCGVLVGVGLGVALLLFLARRRRRRNAPLQTEKKRSGAPRPSTSTSSFGNIISEPIPMSDSTVRTDFILKTPSTVNSRSSATSPTPRGAGGNGYGYHTRLSSTATTLAHHPIGLARSDSTLRTPPNTTTPERGVPVPPIRGMRPNSGSRRHHPSKVPSPLLPPKPGYIQREPSSESINVFADPRTVGGNRPGAKRMTTFTDMMEEAELGEVRRGKPYVPQTPQMPSNR
ncbi:hypothetical protein CH063_02014 [Colletotrichum higginsianum]|uniref:Uncharacterized protein n=2 Tax=Colletotrichum higginsianum TaxID=80884 RepID=H1VFB5_COLHI|nr:hypothetical protein CH63R_00725 [Colletotrichum higginsianum IMI 349063]OBR15545.1 hypothetical protein CH63R_00725 [Colletotrichum higginsianum IMI 349063]TID03744.1 hypothetical protein CH35J_002665 [Colletotrichum higginsianum]GJC92182.1 hypothetical protein ColKHC_01008 [Colletotrichum higginsianum]CCF38918.1 hypothetical protein CH063_02014 [Colletotrichum higginsianum]